MVFCRVGSQRSVAALARCQAGFSGLWYVVLAGRPGRRSECPGDLSLGLVPPGPQHGDEAASQSRWEVGIGEARSSDTHGASPPSRDCPPHSVLPSVVGCPLTLLCGSSQTRGGWTRGWTS